MSAKVNKRAIEPASYLCLSINPSTVDVDLNVSTNLYVVSCGKPITSSETISCIYVMVYMTVLLLLI